MGRVGIKLVTPGSAVRLASVARHVTDCATPPGTALYEPWKLYTYNKCSKISNTFLFLFSNEMLVIRAETHKMLVRKANREDPYQTASSEAV